MRNEPRSVRGRLAAWFHGHRWAAGIGVALSALALVGIAVVVGWAMFTKVQPPTAGLGASSEPSAREPSASAVATVSAGATPSSEPSPTAVATPGFVVPAGVLPPNGRAVVTLDGLRVREQPGINETVLDT